MYRPRGQDVGWRLTAKARRDEVKHGQPKVKAGPGTAIGQIQTGQFSDSPWTVVEGGAVDVEHFGGRRGVAGVVKVEPQRLGEVYARTGGEEPAHFFGQCFLVPLRQPVPEATAWSSATRERCARQQSPKLDVNETLTYR